MNATEQAAMDDGPAGLSDEDLRAYNLRDATNGAISLARLLYSSRSADDGRYPSKFLVDRKVLRDLGDALLAVTEAQEAILKAELRKASLSVGAEGGST